MTLGLLIILWSRAPMCVGGWSGGQGGGSLIKLFSPDVSPRIR